MVEIKIIEVKEITTKEGRKFPAFKTVAKNGKKLDVRFTKECRGVPTETCILRVQDENTNVDTTRQYPIVWIKKIEETLPITRKSNASEYFDTDGTHYEELQGVTGDKLPF